MAGLLDFIMGSGDYADPEKIDPRYGVPMSDVRQAALNSIGNMGAILMAAGQRMEPAQRAAYLAQLGQAGSGFNTDMYNAAQRRLMQAQYQTRMEEMQDDKRIREDLKDPAAFQQKYGFNPAGLGVSDVRQAIRTIRTRDPNEALLRGLQIQKTQRELSQPVVQKVGEDLYQYDEANKSWVKAAGGFEERPLNADERKAYNIPDNVPAKMTSKGPTVMSGGTTINLGDTVDKLAVGDAMKRAQADIQGGEAAAGRINQSNTIRALLDQGVITGFGAEGRVMMGQAAQALGFNVNDERLSNSRALFSALAQRALDAAGAMKGQGQITEPERKLLADVAGSNVNLGADAIRKVLDIADRIDQSDLSKGMRAVGIIKNIPGLKDNPLSSVYDIQQPRSYQRTFNVDGKSVQGRLGVDGKYYYSDETGRRYRIEE
jgi:hypothetical protein